MQLGDVLDQMEGHIHVVGLVAVSVELGLSCYCDE